VYATDVVDAPGSLKIFCKDPSRFPGKIFDLGTTYKQRANHYDKIAETVAQIAEASDGNFLALFPSYAFLREISDRMPPMRRNVMLQRSDMTDYERNAILDILRDKPRRGNLILAVSGGMYAEGVDYQGDMLSGVMVIGKAMPQLRLVR
jgi:DNA excision repair protein ERCC-2